MTVPVNYFLLNPPSYEKKLRGGALKQRQNKYTTVYIALFGAL